MTEPEAAEFLRLSVKTLQRRRRARQIAFIDDAGIRYLRSDLIEYLNARRTPASAPPPSPPEPKYRRAGANARANRETLLALV